MKAQGSTVAPASVQGLGVSLVSRQVGLGEIMVTPTTPRTVLSPGLTLYLLLHTPFSSLGTQTLGPSLDAQRALVALALPG